jgi:hypothetical protein
MARGVRSTPLAGMVDCRVWSRPTFRGDASTDDKLCDLRHFLELRGPAVPLVVLSAL